MKNNRAFARLGRWFLIAALFILTGCASRSPAPVDQRNTAKPSVAPSIPVAIKDTYTVKIGDTVRSIARDHGMDYRELISLNSIENPNQINVGRVLKIKSKTATSGEATSAVATSAPITSDVVVARPIGSDQEVEKRSSSANTDTLKREPKAGKEPYSDQALARAQNRGQAKPSEPVVKTETTPESKPSESASSADEIVWIWPSKGKIVGTFSEVGSKGIDIAGKIGDPVNAASEGKVVYSGTGLRGYGKLVIIKHNNTYLSAYAHNQSILVKEGEVVTRGQKIAEMGNTDADQAKLHFEVRRQGKPVDPLKYLPQR